MATKAQPLTSAGSAASIAAAVQRLGKNNGGYFGDGIDITAVLAEQKEFAHAHGWETHTLPAGAGLALPLFHRPVRQRDSESVSQQVSKPESDSVTHSLTDSLAPLRLYISTGIHGDEPAGPLAVRELLKEDPWPNRAEIWLFPVLNPAGFPKNTRQSASGIDLNRDYKHLRSAEVRAHVAWLEKQASFDFCLCLHEDWEAHGFYIYEINPDDRPSLAEKMVEAVRAVCPIDHSTLIDGRDAKDGIIRPNIDPALRPEWPEAFYLITHKTRLSYTLEAPSDFPLAVRVAALVAATKAAFRHLPA